MISTDWWTATVRGARVDLSAAAATRGDTDAFHARVLSSYERCERNSTVSTLSKCLFFSLSNYTFLHYKYLIVYSADYDTPLSIANFSDALAFVSMSDYFVKNKCSYYVPTSLEIILYHTM